MSMFVQGGWRDCLWTLCMCLCVHLHPRILVHKLQGLQDSSLKKHPTDQAGCVQLRVVSPQHDMYSISHITLCSTTVKCMTDTQLYCLKFMFLVYTYGVCHVILCTYGVPTVAV